MNSKTSASEFQGTFLNPRPVKARVRRACPQTDEAGIGSRACEGSRRTTVTRVQRVATR
jgi:hypothetical protein